MRVSLISTVKISAAVAILSSCNSQASQQAFGPTVARVAALQQEFGLLGLSGSAPVNTAAITAQADRPSSMAPDAQAQDLLYVSDVRTVTVYSYPRGKFEGTLRHFYIATGMCVDKKGDVFIVDGGYSKVFEYAHGGTKRTATLDSPTKDPVGCSIDPTTGNLAVASLGFGSAATVAIYKNARGKATTYQDSAFQQMYFCGYDDKGNLFVDGVRAPGGTGDFVFAMLPKGNTTFTEIALNQYIGFPGGVQWDGKHVAIGDQTTNIYEFAINGSTGTIVGTTHMDSGAQYVKQFWIENHAVIAPNVYFGNRLRSDALLFNYPAGGRATKAIVKGVKDAQGAVVSKAGI